MNAARDIEAEELRLLSTRREVTGGCARVAARARVFKLGGGASANHRGSAKAAANNVGEHLRRKAENSQGRKGGTAAVRATPAKRDAAREGNRGGSNQNGNVERTRGSRNGHRRSRGTLQRHHRAVRLGVAFEGQHVFVDVIRVDIDPSKTADFYPARLGIVADAAPAMSAPRNEAEFRNAFANGLAADRPTVIVVREGEEWLKQTRRMEWDRGVKDPPRATGPRP